jgi:hypothetical protein
VAGGVDDVDLGAAQGQGDALGQDGDAAFALQVVGVEELFAGRSRWGQAALPPEKPACPQRLLCVSLTSAVSPLTQVSFRTGLFHNSTVDSRIGKLSLTLSHALPLSCPSRSPALP